MTEHASVTVRRFVLRREYGSWRIAGSEGTSREDLQRIYAAQASFSSLAAAIAWLFPDAIVSSDGTAPA